MRSGFSRIILRAVGRSGLRQARDEHLLAGADEASVQAIGASTPVLSLFRQDFAALSPDLVHEAERAVRRR